MEAADGRAPADELDPKDFGESDGTLGGPSLDDEMTSEPNLGDGAEPTTPPDLAFGGELTSMSESDADQKVSEELLAQSGTPESPAESDLMSSSTNSSGSTNDVSSSSTASRKDAKAVPPMMSINVGATDVLGGRRGRKMRAVS